MGNVILDMSMSLDGFIAGAGGEDGGLYNWYFAPSTGEGDRNQEVIQELITRLGAIVMGKRTYGMGDDYDADGGEDPYDAARIVLTHHVPAKAPAGKTPTIFVTDGIKSALEQARAAAGERDVAIGGGANVAQQYLKAGLIDEIQIHLVPLLLGEGIRLFEHLGDTPIELESTRVIEAKGVTHLLYRVIRDASENES
jgi:dihydrofolate reductase